MKRTNLITVIKMEIEKGNRLVTKDGVLLKEAAVEKRIEDSFFSDLKTRKIPISTSFDDYKAEKMTSYIPLNDILEHLELTYGFNEPEPQPEEPEPEPRPEEPEPEPKPESKKKGGVKKNAKS